jgi:hypothetical protein
MASTSFILCASPEDLIDTSYSPRCSLTPFRFFHECRSTASTAGKVYEKDIELITASTSICGPQATAARESDEMIKYDNTSYSIPADSPLLNITHGKHQFPFSLGTSEASPHGVRNLPASFRLEFPQSRDSCSISYVLEYVSYISISDYATQITLSKLKRRDNHSAPHFAC